MTCRPPRPLPPELQLPQAQRSILHVPKARFLPHAISCAGSYFAGQICHSLADECGKDLLQPRAPAILLEEGLPPS